jgi:putative acetyltransferase
MITLLRTTSSNVDFNPLVEGLDRELWQRYREEQANYAPLNKIESNTMAVIAYLDNHAAGCACLKECDKVIAELKRMYVLPAFRGHGIAGRILAELECWARECSIKKIILETGEKQPEAISLYLKAGYEPIDNFGPYADMPASICMSKDL